MGEWVSLLFTACNNLLLLSGMWADPAKFKTMPTCVAFLLFWIFSGFQDLGAKLKEEGYNKKEKSVHSLFVWNQNCFYINNVTIPYFENMVLSLPFNPYSVIKYSEVFYKALRVSGSEFYIAWKWCTVATHTSRVIARSRFGVCSQRNWCHLGHTLLAEVKKVAKMTFHVFSCKWLLPIYIEFALHCDAGRDFFSVFNLSSVPPNLTS